MKPQSQVKWCKVTQLQPYFLGRFIDFCKCLMMWGFYFYSSSIHNTLEFLYSNTKTTSLNAANHTHTHLWSAVDQTLQLQVKLTVVFCIIMDYYTEGHRFFSDLNIKGLFLVIIILFCFQVGCFCFRTGTISQSCRLVYIALHCKTCHTD